MSRLPVALIVCGVSIAALSPGGHAFPAGTLNVADAPRPVLLVAHENKKPHGKPLGLPVRKPGKPVVRETTDNKKANQQSTQPRSVRDKRLCRALQACRNEFVRCKGKIKHPDQSQAWSDAKEECGAYYKACVEKDFQGGEWFFTRWFYFQELDCK